MSVVLVLLLRLCFLLSARAVYEVGLHPSELNFSLRRLLTFAETLSKPFIVKTPERLLPLLRQGQ